MPKEGDRSHKDDPQERRNHRSSSHHHRGHKHSARYRERSREHHRHRPYHRETTPRSSTRIYFNGSDSAPSVSLHTDHVTLASNLSSLWEKRQIGGMLQVFEDCCQMLDRLRQDQTTQPEFWPPSGTSTSCSSGHRGANQSNLVAVPKSPAKNSTKPSFSKVIEKCKKKSLVPADHTKQWLYQRLASHSEAKLESIDISLFCPLTHSRMATPVRGQNCQHIHCFDGEAFCNLMWDKPSSKWKCPICKCLTPLSALVVDGFILEILASVPEDVRTVEFTSRGFWRIKETTSLKAINAPVNANHDHGDNEVIDLTFDTPQKVVKKNSSDNNGNFVPQVIDLTLSP